MKLRSIFWSSCHAYCVLASFRLVAENYKLPKLKSMRRIVEFLISRPFVSLSVPQHGLHDSSFIMFYVARDTGYSRKVVFQIENN